VEAEAGGAERRREGARGGGCRLSFECNPHA